MKGILIYQPTSKSAPLADFIDGLDPRLREKILLRLYFLTQLEKPEMKEPHFKRFSIERYRDLWELRVKSKVLIRIIFCMLPNGDILLSMDSYTADISSWLCHLTHIQPQNRSPLRSAVHKLQGL